MENLAVLSLDPPSSILSTPPLKLPRRLRSLADMRGVWSLGDQAILSLGNFLTTWLLLRTQSGWYGNYYTVLTFITFLNNLHMALVTYPISITSAGITDSELRRRIRRAIVMTLLLAIPESIVIATGTAMTTHTSRLNPIPAAVATASATHTARLIPLVIAALVFWQLQETVRRALMARLEHRRAIAGDIISYLGQAAAVWFVIHHGNISIEWAFALIALTSAIAFMIQAAQLKLYLPSHCAPMHSAHEQARIHFSLGQWILLANMVNLLTIYSVPWMIRYAHGEAGVAMYSAVLLVLNASNPLLAAVANLITPVVAKMRAEAHLRGETGAHQAQSAAVKYSLQGAIILFPFFAFLIILPGAPLHLLYKSGSPFLQLGNPMRVFAVVYAMMYVSAVLNSYLCGLGKSQVPFYGQVANAIVTCIITLPLLARFGIMGAAVGGLFPVMAQIAVGVYHVLKARSEIPTEAQPLTHGFPVHTATIKPPASVTI